MPCLNVTGIIVRNPGFTVRVFRHENFHRKVDCDTGRSDHPGRSGFRVAKDQELGRAHLKTRLFGLTAVVDQSEKALPAATYEKELSDAADGRMAHSRK